MESTQRSLLAPLTKELSNRPVLSNVVFGFILLGLEKLVELEFECPCNPTWNGVFSSALFIIPGALACMLMLVIQKAKFDELSKKNLYSLIPAIVWWALLFFDGQYFACAMTFWKGSFAIVDQDAGMKWCKPNVTSGELMLTIQKFYSISQGTGVALLIAVVILVCVIKRSHGEGENAGS